MPNIDLMQDVLDHIKANPATWNQSMWRCGTKYCFAGHAALMSGWKPVQGDEVAQWEVRGFRSKEEALAQYEANLRGEGGEPRAVDYWESRMVSLDVMHPSTSSTVTLTGKERRSIMDVAEEVLGIDDETGLVLFHSDNSLRDLESMIEEIKLNGRLQPEDWDR